MSINEICLMDATELAQKIREKKLSPTEVVEAFLAQTDKVNSEVNAYALLPHELARKEAKEAEAAITSGQELGPLHGVPVAIKDLTEAKGVETTFGSYALRGNIPENDSILVERTKRAGGIQMGRTNSPEFGHSGASSRNLVYGATVNPWNPAHSPGGSSGGSAVAVATAMAPVAEGTDGGGSVRMPASCCGIFGLKPTFGRIPVGILETHFETLANFGPMTWTVRDAALLMSVWTGPHTGDALSLPDTGDDWLGSLDGDVDGMKIAYSPDLGWAVDPRVNAVVDSAVGKLADIGCKVEQVEVELTQETYDAEFGQWSALCGSLFDKYVTEENRPHMTPYLLEMIEKGKAMSAVEYLNRNIVRRCWYDQVERILDTHDFLVCPTLASLPPSIDSISTGPEVVGGKPVHGWLGWALTWPFNLSMHPVATIPAGFAEGNLPVGMQIISRRFRETDILRLSARFEEAAPWADRRPEVATA
jgi:Asp-tRNA(Asn)/Glu-tRNA(Gln) amidotransferase A subunit family amidase